MLYLSLAFQGLKIWIHGIYTCFRTYISDNQLIIKDTEDLYYMWNNHPVYINPVDKTIINEGFICLESYTSSFEYLNAEYNPFNRALFADMIQFMQVHPEHPIEVMSASSSAVRILPVGELERKPMRMPIRLYEDKLDYDVVSFLMTPFDRSTKRVTPSSLLREFSLADSVKLNEYGSSSSGSLVYMAHQVGLNENHILSIHLFLLLR